MGMKIQRLWHRRMLACPCPHPHDGCAVLMGKCNQVMKPACEHTRCLDTDLLYLAKYSSSTHCILRLTAQHVMA